ncbi:MAG: hypothetical protein KGR47_09330 [Acidobacteria bacterium]|nr:hypothetical protein [Acidobacteriota bacterium]
MRPGFERLFVLIAIVYVVVTGWAMSNLSYDVWGGFVLAPVLVLLTLPLLRKAFGGDLAPLLPIAILGLILKLVGSIFRYWVAFDAYGGSADASGYHDAGKLLAGQIRSGAVGLSKIIPSGTGTDFVERVTGAVYTLFGSSRMGGFFFFSWLAYLGTVLYFLAAVRAVPNLSVARYAWLLFLAPSLLFWPSSIGKEALMMPFLGAIAYGGARLMHRRWGGATFPLLVIGVVVAGAVRPHVVAIWIAGILVASVATLAMGRRVQGSGTLVGALVLVVIATIAFVGVASSALRFLDPKGESLESTQLIDRVDAIFNTTEGRTEAGGSTLEAVAINSPLDWPYAVYRTLTRPLINEVESFTEFLPAVETTALVLLALFGWRRLAHIPRLMRSTPYLWFALSVLVAFGLAFSVFRNLGLLARQRSLVVPFMVLLVCLPPMPHSVRSRPSVSPGRRNRGLSGVPASDDSVEVHSPA